MNKIVESINFASDAYWGDPERFNFRAMIDSYTTTTEMNQGQDRTVKTTFQITMMGHIVPDSINTSIANMNKFYSKSAIKFGLETAGSEEILQGKADTPASTNTVGRFYDNLTGKSEVNINFSGMTAEERTYLALSNTVDTNNNSYVIDNVENSITFANVTLVTPPANFPDHEIDDFLVTIGGLTIEPSAIDRIVQEGADLLVDFHNSNLGYNITEGMEITITGKLNG